MRDNDGPKIVDNSQSHQKDLQSNGTRLPNSASTPSAKAMSVPPGSPTLRG